MTAATLAAAVQHQEAVRVELLLAEAEVERAYFHEAPTEFSGEAERLQGRNTKAFGTLDVSKLNATKETVWSLAAPSTPSKKWWKNWSRNCDPVAAEAKSPPS